MATVGPPPSKRQRVEVAEKARQQQEIQTIPEGLGNVRIQFIDHTGQKTGAPVSVAVVNASVKNLELLVNTLQGNVGKQELRIPYFRDPSMIFQCFHCRVSCILPLLPICVDPHSLED